MLSNISSFTERESVTNMTLLTTVVLTWSSRLTVENLGVVGAGRSATAGSSVSQHPVRATNVTTGICREDPSYRFTGPRLTRVNPCLGSAGAERHALPRWSMIALWESPRLGQPRRRQRPVNNRIC